MKNHLSINIYSWDYTAAKNHDFSKILDVNLNMPVKDGKKNFGNVSERKFSQDFKNGIGFFVA